MTDFRKLVLSILKDGQELSLGDKLIIGQEIDTFLDQWKQATGEEAVPSISTLEIFSDRLTNFGYKMPIVDSWLKDDEELIRDELRKKNMSGFPERNI